MEWQKKGIVVLGFAFRLPQVSLSNRLSADTDQRQANCNCTALPLIISPTPSTLQIRHSTKFFQVSSRKPALISATIPCLRSFVLNLGTGYLGGTHFDKMLAAGESNRAYTSTDCYALALVRKRRQAR